ncbi:MAG: triose-phosphate isomerase [Synergistetes bacterium]|nr:triose-phosphate isomerase [Synergistota bacterium]
MKRMMIAGNWKMNKTDEEAIELTSELVKLVGDVKEPKVVVCPPFTSMRSVRDIIKDSNICLGAQNMFWEESGAYTGEISSLMLKSVGCRYVIIGHSERRGYFGETDEKVNKKLKSAMKHGLVPILCVGETLGDRDRGISKDIVKGQVEKAVKGLDLSQVNEFVVAYEPVWAIGTGRPATAEDAEDMISFIRSLLVDAFGDKVMDKIYLLYGGSVKPDNIAEFVSQPTVQGALVGGASLSADKFASIVEKSKV